MTTIAWDGKTLASDTLITRNGGVNGYAVKAVRRGSIVAATCGTTSIGQRFLDWFRGGMVGHPPSMRHGDDEAVGIVIDPEGRIIEWNGGCPPDVVTAPFAAWGSGYQYALGAMSGGATAAESVALAAHLDHGTGGPITVLSVR